MIAPRLRATPALRLQSIRPPARRLRRHRLRSRLETPRGQVARGRVTLRAVWLDDRRALPLKWGLLALLLLGVALLEVPL